MLMTLKETYRDSGTGIKLRFWSVSGGYMFTVESPNITAYESDVFLTGENYTGAAYENYCTCFKEGQKKLEEMVADRQDLMLIHLLSQE